MSFQDTILYDQFADARRLAVELTDQYYAIPKGDPTRADAWDKVVLQTETARQLLERWLRTNGAYPSAASRVREPSAVG
jgi:hypothetical protein